MYFTDRGIEELETRRGDEDIAVTWLAERMRDFVNLNPDFETAIDRLATFLARDEEEDLLFITAQVRQLSRLLMTVLTPAFKEHAIHLDFSEMRYIVVS